MSTVPSTPRRGGELPGSFAYLEIDVPPGMTLAAWRRERAPPRRPRRLRRRLLRRAWRGKPDRFEPQEEKTMNQVQLIGRLTRDPELGQTAGGKPVCDMRLAVPRRDRGADPVYVDVIAYDVLAELCGDHLEKGRQLAVTGRLDYQEWEARDGSGKRSKHSIVAAEVDFLARPNPDGSHEEPAAAAA